MTNYRVMIALVVLPIALVGHSAGYEFTVTVTTDSNDGVCDAHCSLREAVLTANSVLGKDTVIIPAGTYVLSIPGTQEDLGNTGDLDLTDEVDIIGAGPKVTAIDANQIDRVIDVHGIGQSYLIRGVTLRGGGHLDQGGQGGGGFWLKGENSATLESVHLVENQVGTGGVHHGGGLLQTDGVLTMRDCLVRNNTASNGGGIATLSAESAYIIGCTISLNHANSQTGGVYASYTETHVVNSTVASNTGSSVIAGGVYSNGEYVRLESCTLSRNQHDDLYMTSVVGSQTHLINTLIDGSCSGNLTYMVSGGGNFEGPGDTCGLDPINDRANVPDIFLEPLAYRGGPTPVLRPESSSSIVDADEAHPGCQTFDQRGVVRAEDGNNDGVVRCDVGAVEVLYGEIFIDGFECGYTTAWTTAGP